MGNKERIAYFEFTAKPLPLNHMVIVTKIPPMWVALCFSDLKNLKTKNEY